MTTLRTTWRHVQLDLRRVAQMQSAFLTPQVSLLRSISMLLMPSVMAVAIYRHAHWLHQRGLRRLARVLSWLNYVAHKIWIDPACRIGPGLYVPHTTGVVIECNAGRNLTVYALGVVSRRYSLDASECPDIEIGDDVTIGTFSVSNGAAHIGNGVRFGPFSFVDGSLAAGTTVIAATRLSTGKAGDA